MRWTCALGASMPPPVDARSGPAQRGLGIPTAGGSTSRSKSRKLGSCSTVRFRPPPGWRMPLRGPYGRLAQLPYAAANRPARSSGGPCNRCLATTPGRRRLSGKHQPPHPLVHNGGNRLVTSLNRSFNYHPLSIAEHVVKNKLFRDRSLSKLRRRWPDTTLPRCIDRPLAGRNADQCRIARQPVIPFKQFDPRTHCGG